MDCSLNNLGLLGYIGIAALLYCGGLILLAVWHGLKLFGFPHEVNFKDYGEWAVVTGATDGIGKSYALALAKRGMNIVLISRSPEKLTDVAKEIEESSCVKVKTLVIDFSGGLEIYDNVRKGLEGLDVGVLVNNVGMSYAFPEYFSCLQSDKIVMDMMNVNMTSVTMMTRIILPKMDQKKKGVIINIASSSGFMAVPLLTQYSASKAYVDFFSRALQKEYSSRAGCNIIIQSVTPFFIATKLSKIRYSNFLVPTPDAFVRQALATVGATDQTCGYYTHSIQAQLISLMPSFIIDRISMKQMEALRKKALKRLEKVQ